MNPVFAIEKSLDGKDFSVTATVGPNITSCDETGLPSTMTYYYRLNAWNQKGYSGYSNISSSTVSDDIAPSAPTKPDISNYFRQSDYSEMAAFI